MFQAQILRAFIYDTDINNFLIQTNSRLLCRLDVAASALELVSSLNLDANPQFNPGWESQLLGNKPWSYQSWCSRRREKEPSNKRGLCSVWTNARLFVTQEHSADVIAGFHSCVAETHHPHILGAWYPGKAGFWLLWMAVVPAWKILMLQDSHIIGPMHSWYAWLVGAMVWMDHHHNAWVLKRATFKSPFISVWELVHTKTAVIDQWDFKGFNFGWIVTFVICKVLCSRCQLAKKEMLTEK